MPSAIEVRRINAAPEVLTIEWAEGGVSEFASLWLLDNRPEDRDAYSGQRLVDITDLPESPRIRSAVARAGALEVATERFSLDDGVEAYRRMAEGSLIGRAVVVP